MRLPSLDRMAAAAGWTARRFPLVLLAALAATASGILLVDATGDTKSLERLLYSSTLGLPLFVSLTLLAERRGWLAQRRWTARAVGLVVLAVVYLLYPGWSEEVAVLRYIQLSAAFHLFAAFAPFLGAGSLHGFWQYNRILFLRAVTTALFAGVLFAGLAGALAGVDNLLGFDVEGETYGKLWIVIAFLFTTWFFLSGVPEDLEVLEDETEYPAVIKVFSQYILVPIVTVYLAILTAYLGKIVVTRVWPSGWIGYLVSGVAVAGILSLLLVHPIQDRDENRWIGNYARWFYVAMLPAIAMLLMAIWQRVDQYGITEKRYFLVVLSLWLAGIALFYIIKRSRNIKIIPISLCLVSLVTLAGPWGAYAVSHRSQVTRLERILQANDMLAGGVARPATSTVSFADRKELSAIIRYLAEVHGTASLDPLFGGRLAEIDTVTPGLGPSKRGQAELRAALMVASLDVEYEGSWITGLEDQFNLFAQQDTSIIGIAGFDYAWRYWGNESGPRVAGGSSYRFELDQGRSAVVMRRDGATLIELPLTPLIERVLTRQSSQVRRSGLAAEALMIEGENESVSLVGYIRFLQGTMPAMMNDPAPGPGRGASGAESYRINNLAADFYWTEKPVRP